MSSVRLKDVKVEVKIKHQKRRIFAQIIAGSFSGFLMLNVGASISFSTNVISGLSSGDDIIKSTNSHMSWIGSLCFISMAISSIASGFMLDRYGRKKNLILVNIPSAVAWIMLWNSSSINMLLLAFAILGLGTGLFKSSVYTYLGEICEPSVRGVLAASNGVFMSAGIFYNFLLGTLFPWRTAAAILLALPILSILFVLIVCIYLTFIDYSVSTKMRIPETPIWLLSKGRKKEAVESLRWIRGWVDELEVAKEMEDLIRYNEDSQKCTKCDEKASECVHKHESQRRKFINKLEELIQRKARRPLILAIWFFFFMVFTGHTAYKPNLINIYKVFNMPVDPQWAAVFASALAIFGAIACMILVKICGKRPIILTSMLTCSITLILLGKYAYDYIPHGTGTYGIVYPARETSSLPIIYWILNIVSNTVGIYPTPSLISAEIFPYATRGISSGLVFFCNSIISFIATKTHINIESALDIHGTFFLYATITFIGWIYLYISLPETENETQVDIEAKFSSDSIVFADDYIYKTVKGCFETKEKKAIPDADDKIKGISYITV